MNSQKGIAMTSILIGIVLLVVVALMVRGKLADAKADLHIVTASEDIAFEESVTGKLLVSPKADFDVQRVLVSIVAKAADGKLGGKSTRFVDAYRQPVLLAENTHFTRGAEREFVFEIPMPSYSLAEADEQSLAKHYRAKHPMQWQLTAELVCEGANISKKLALNIKGESMLRL